MGLSRDDAGRFLPDYVDEKKAGVFAADPFQSLDTKGVGMLMRWGIEKGRKTRAKLKVASAGEHGGDADSVKFCHGHWHGLRQRVTVPRPDFALGRSTGR